jgi:hypothetical protein
VATVDMAVAVDTGTARGEGADSATVAGATAVTVGAATADMVVDTEIAFTRVAATAAIAMAVDMDTTSTLAAEAMAVAALVVDTGMDTAGEDITAAVITDIIMATGVVAATTAVHTGAVRYSALDSAMFHRGRFATTPTGIRYRATCRHTARTRIEVAGPEGGPWRIRTPALRFTRTAGRQQDRYEWRGGQGAKPRTLRLQRGEEAQS